MKNKEIAEKLKISPATVSLALNNRAGVSEETRRRVIELKNDSLKNDLKSAYKEETGVEGGEIGFIIYKQTGKIVSETPFFVTLTEVICRYAKKNGYSVEIIYHTFRDDLETFIDGINQSNLAGCLIVGTELDRKTVGKIKATLKKPFVILDAAFPGMDVDSVLMDNRGGIFQAIQHAVSLGHREIGFINCNEQVYNFTERFESYKYYLNEFGLDYNPEFVYEVPYMSKEISACLKAQMRLRKELPSAMIAANDIIALGAYSAFFDMNLRIPEEISLIGFDNMPTTKYVTPQLTSINLNNHIIGKNAVCRLIELIQQPHNNTVHIQNIVSVNLVVRDSVSQK